MRSVKKAGEGIFRFMPLLADARTVCTGCRRIRAAERMTFGRTQPRDPTSRSRGEAAPKSVVGRAAGGTGWAGADLLELLIKKVRLRHATGGSLLCEPTVSRISPSKIKREREKDEAHRHF